MGMQIERGGGGGKEKQQQTQKFVQRLDWKWNRMSNVEDLSK